MEIDKARVTTLSQTRHGVRFNNKLFPHRGSSGFVFVEISSLFPFNIDGSKQSQCGANWSARERALIGRRARFVFVATRNPVFRLAGGGVTHS